MLLLLLLLVHRKTERTIPVSFNTPTIFSEVKLPAGQKPATIPSKPHAAAIHRHQSADHFTISDRVLQKDLPNNEVPITDLPNNETVNNPSDQGLGNGNTGAADHGSSTNELPMQGHQTETVPSIVDIAEIEPLFKGGEAAMFEYFQEHTKLSSLEIIDGYTGNPIYIEFVVSDKGEIDQVRLVKSCGNGKFDREALRLVKAMPTWTPGKVGHMNVNVRMLLPISFGN